MPDIWGIIGDAEQCDPELLPSVWWHKVNRVFDSTLEASMLYCTPSSNVSIDDCMVRCFGRSSHTYKMPNKPIPQGYKFYALSDHGYIWIFTPFTRSEGLIETISLDGLINTGSMVHKLIECLPKLANTYSIKTVVLNLNRTQRYFKGAKVLFGPP
jgi:anaphase-promoting complex subunit 8